MADLVVARCEDYKSRSSVVDVVQEFDQMGISLEQLLSLEVDYKSLAITPSRFPPRCEDFLHWTTSQLFDATLPRDLSADVDDDRGKDGKIMIFQNKLEN